MNLKEELEKLKKIIMGAMGAMNFGQGKITSSKITSPLHDPTPTPTPTIPYRNPQMKIFMEQEPVGSQEIQSAVRQATKDPYLQSLLMDLALEESGLRPTIAPPQAPQYGAFQFTPQTSKWVGLTNPLSATESAKKTAELIEKGFLNWWEVLRRGGATKTPLLKLYSEKELKKKGYL